MIRQILKRNLLVSKKSSFTRSVCSLHLHQHLKPTEKSIELGIPSNLVFENVTVLGDAAREKDEVIDVAWYETRRKPVDAQFLPVLNVREPEKNSSEEELENLYLNPYVFNEAIRFDLIYDNVKWRRAGLRKGLAKVKTISERRGGGRKPHPQKGTGRARQGTIRATHMRKGGRVHGPKPRDFSYTLLRSVQNKGLRTTLTCKFIENNITVVDSLEGDFDSATLDEFLISAGLSKRKKYLFLDIEENESIKNILAQSKKKHKFLTIPNLFVYDMMVTNKIIISKEGLEALSNRLDTKRKLPIANEDPHEERRPEIFTIRDYVTSFKL